jgi:hypothetical protein
MNGASSAAGIQCAQACLDGQAKVHVHAGEREEKSSIRSESPAEGGGDALPVHRDAEHPSRLVLPFTMG